MEPILLVSHDPAWPEKYQQEKMRITRLLGPLLITTYHIGSTSIPGMKAKPIIDILALVRDIDKIDGFNEEFENLGYAPRGSAGIEGRKFFRKRTPFGGFHLHVYDISDSSIRHYIDFRDYLIAHPSSAQEYEELKIELATKFRNERPAYTEGKTEFIKEIEQIALEWKNEIFSGDASEQ